MFHHVARALPGTLLFRTHPEAAALWARLTALDGLVAACLMPDHVHVVLAHGEATALSGVRSGYSRWRNRRRGDAGSAWQVPPPPESLPDALHRERTVRYVHLNPCRAGIVKDPLEWPWSTHRDAVGLARAPAVPPRRDPAAFHAHVSGDPSVAVTGTPLPEPRYGQASWEEVEDAVGAVLRLDRVAIHEDRRALRLIARLAAVYGVAGNPEIAERLGPRRSWAWRMTRGVPGPGARHSDPDLRLALRILGDPRFYALPVGDLRRLPAWARYRARS